MPESDSAAGHPTPMASPRSTVPLLVISAPSCAGKDTLLGRLMRARPEIRKPVTTTTRLPRAHERDGVHYHFLDEAAFEAGVGRGDFIEHARVPRETGPYYGLSKAALGAVRRTGGVPVVILDVQGAAAVRQLLPTRTVFIEAPLDQLVERIRQRRPGAEFEARVEAIRYELSQAPLYDVRISNPDGGTEQAFRTLLSWYEREVLTLVQASRRPPPRRLR
jgi:guanylate kinase